MTLVFLFISELRIEKNQPVSRILSYTISVDSSYHLNQESHQRQTPMEKYFEWERTHL